MHLQAVLEKKEDYKSQFNPHPQIRDSMPQTYIQQYINSITEVDLKPQGVCALLHDAKWLILDTEHALDGFQDMSEYF